VGLADLPFEILEVVVSSLGDDLASRANLMQTCKRLYDASTRRSVWKSAENAVMMLMLGAQHYAERRASGWGISSQDEFFWRHKSFLESRITREAGLLDYFGREHYASLALVAATSAVPPMVRRFCGLLLRTSPLKASKPSFLDQLARLAVGSGCPETLEAVQGRWGVDVGLLRDINLPTGVLFRLAARAGSVPMILALEDLGFDMQASQVTLVIIEEAAMHGHVAVLDYMASLLGLTPVEVLEWVVTPAVRHADHPIKSGLVWARKFLAAANVHPRLPLSAFRGFDLHPVVRVARRAPTDFLEELITGEWLGETREAVLEALRSNGNGVLRELVQSKNVAALRLLRACGLTAEDARAQYNFALWSVFWHPSRNTVEVLRELRDWGLGPADLQSLRRYIPVSVFQGDARLLRELREHWDGVHVLGLGFLEGRTPPLDENYLWTFRSNACLLCDKCLMANWTDCVQPRVNLRGLYSLDGTNHAYVLAAVVDLVNADVLVELRRHWGFGPEHARANERRVIRVVVETGCAGKLETLRREFGLNAGDGAGMVAAASERGHFEVLRELREGFGLGVGDARARDNLGIRSAWKGETHHASVAGCGVRVLRELALFGLSGEDARANDNELLGEAIAQAQHDVVVALARAPWGLGAEDFCQVIPALGRMWALKSPWPEEQARGVAVVRALRLLYGMGGFCPEEIMRVVVPQLARLGACAMLVVDELVELGLDAKAVASGLGA